MKNLIKIISVLAVFSLNIFSQQNTNVFRINSRSEKDLDKIVQLNPKYVDQTSNKISPLLNIFLNKINFEKELKIQLPESFSSFKKIIYFYKDELDDLIIPIFIRTSSIADAMNTITMYNGKVATIAVDIITAEVPITSVYKIAVSSEIIYVDASTISELKIDVSRLEVKVDLLHNGSGISRPYKGNNVVVGVLDSGIDWTHPDFKNTGGSRIKYLWDMSGSGNPPSGYDYGTEYSKAQLDANQCQEIDGDDGHGHGTHVSGTAAGNGSALSNYIGMAPESDIVFVKGFRTGPGFANTDVVNGCNYIFQKAQQLGKPSVINLSLGGHFGPHDGTTLYEQALSNLTGNGKIIVAAAGNEGGETIHLSYTAAGTSYNDCYETFFELFNGTSSLLADMWYTGGNISVGLAAYNPSDGSLIGYTNGIPPGQKIEDLAFTINSTTYGYVTIDATGINNPNNSSNEVVVYIDGHNGQVNIGDVWWSLYTFGSGTFDAWAVSGGIFSTYNGQSWFKPGDSEKTIGSPGSSSKVICVGSYVTKDHWVDINGVTQYQPGNPTISAISSFSSIGPTRDGRLKPDIIAPGEVIVAPYSSFLTQTPPEDILLGGKYQKMQGTSMASPHVTGVVALMLEKNESLNYDQTVTILKSTTKKDSYTGTSPNNIYGHGKLDAYNAFLNTTGGGGVQTANLVYDDGAPSSGYYWNNSGQGSVNRMTPTLNDAILTQMEIYITGVETGTATYKPVALGNSGGSPGSDLVSLNFKTAASYPAWDPTDLTSYNISLNGDFFVGLIYDGTNKPIYGSDPVDNGRAWDFDGSSWSTFNETYFIRATIQTTTSVAEISNEIPTEFDLSYNYPNPFNPSTKFRYALPEGRNVKIIIYDINGSKVTELVNNYQGAGTYEVTWNGKNDFGQQVASGTYIYNVIAGNFVQTKKMVLLK